MASIFELALVQNEGYERTLTVSEDDVRRSFSGMELRAQVRLKESVHSPLVADLSAYLTVESSGEDDAPAGDRIRILIPGSVTAAIDERPIVKAGAWWDVFADDFLVLQGPVSIDPAVTRMVP